MTEGLEDSRMPQQQIQEEEEEEEEDTCLLNEEMDNAGNALIFDGNNRIIYFRLRISDSHDFIKLIKEYE